MEVRPRDVRETRADTHGSYLEHATCPIAVIVAERSLVVDPPTPEYTGLFEDRGVPRMDIPAAHNHLLIDQPIALVAALRALLQTWARHE